MAVRIPITSSFSDRGFKDADRAIARLEKTGGAAGGWAKATKAADDAVVPLNRALVGVAAAGGLAVKAASNQQQAFGALEAVYKGNAGAMQEWARGQDQIGLSAAEAANQASYLGSMLKGAGASTQEAAAQSQKLVGLGADLAATYGGNAADAVGALGAAMRGEYDPLERFGVSIKKADVNARLAADGNSKLTGEARKSAEAAALQALIWEKTADAQGQAGREADSAAGASARAGAALKDAGADITTSLLPAAAALASKLATLANWLSQHPALLYTLVGALVAARVAIAANNAVMAIYLNRQAAAAAADKVAAVAKAAWTAAAVAARVAGAVLSIVFVDGTRKLLAWVAATAASTLSWAKNTAAMVAARVAQVAMSAASKAAAAAQWALNVALNANPIGLVVAAVALLVGGIVLLWKKNEGFRNAVTAAWSAIKSAISSAVRTIKGVIDTLIGKFQALWDKILRIKDSIGGVLDAINPFSAAGVQVNARYSPAPVIAGYSSASGRSVSIGQLVYHGSGDVATDGRTLRNLIETGDVEQGRRPGAPRRVAW